MLGARHVMGDRAVVRRAWQAGADRFFGGALDSLNGGGVVLGQRDANLANFLWDGTQVQIVDFEDSGPSDRAFELAVLVEHLSAWSDAGLSAEASSRTPAALARWRWMTSATVDHAWYPGE
jgi:Ser/Thr protein kinase RdoA (MazF antagonist)